MEVNEGPVVKKLLNILKEKVSLKKNSKNLFYNVEKLKTYRKRKMKKKNENWTIYSHSIKAP